MPEDLAYVSHRPISSLAKWVDVHLESGRPGFNSRWAFSGSSPCSAFLGQIPVGLFWVKSLLGFLWVKPLLGFSGSSLCWAFSGSSHTSILKIGALAVATLQGTWHYRASTGIGWPCVSTLRLGEIASSFFFCVSGHARSSVRWVRKSPQICRTFSACSQSFLWASTGLGHVWRLKALKVGQDCRMWLRVWGPVLHGDSKFDLQLLSQCGSTCSCLSRSVPDGVIH